MITIPVSAIKQCCYDVGISEGFIDQHQDVLEKLVVRAAAWQLRRDKKAIRSWYYNTDINRPSLLEVLDDSEDC
jgi:hypothetical protein